MTLLTYRVVYVQVCRRWSQFRLILASFPVVVFWVLNLSTWSFCVGKSTQVPGNWTSVSTYFECPFLSWGLFLFNLLEVVLSTGEESLAEARRSQVEECVLFAVGKEAWGFQLYFLAPAHRHCLWKRAAETCCFVPASSWSRPFPARLDLIFSQGCPLGWPGWELTSSPSPHSRGSCQTSGT